MRALVYDGTLRLVDGYPVPRPNPGEALVRVGMAGICSTDLEIAKGYANFHGVLGHEFVGTVESAPGRHDLEGKRVVGEINVSCKHCSLCDEGLSSHCKDRSALGIRGKDGAFADYLTIPNENLHQVPESVADEEAVFVEPLAAAFRITEQVQIRPDDRILVLGDGRLGLLSAFVLKTVCVDVTLAGKHTEKMKIASMKGIRTCHVRDLPLKSNDGSKDFHIVVEATGSATGLMSALENVRPCGTIVQKSTTAKGADINLSKLVVDEITLIGSRCGPFEPSIRALKENAIDVRPLISAVYPFSDALHAFFSANDHKSIKVLLDFR